MILTEQKYKRKIIYPKYIVLYCLFFFISGFPDIKTSASSFLNNHSQYSHKNAVDGKLSTAWVEGDSGDGIGEWIKLDFGAPVDLQYLGIVNGYKKTSVTGEDLWFQNNRIQSVTIHFSDSSIIERTFEQPDNNIIQYFKIGKKTSFVKISIDTIIKGDKYSDACISEVFPIFDKNYQFSDYELIKINDGVYDTIWIKNCIFLNPVSILFNSKVWGCDKANLYKINDSVYYFDEDFLLSVGTPFLSFNFSWSEVPIEQLRIRNEYRYGWHGGDWIFFYKGNNLLCDNCSICSKWDQISLVEGNYKVKIEKFNVQTSLTDSSLYKKARQWFKDSSQQYFSRNNNWFEWFISSNQIDSLQFFNYATHMEITFKQNNKIRRMLIIFLNNCRGC
ncbi:MAG: discoidin domain-containing protein [Chitinispirillaceae bacterium]|nr:discoidin domain-containing protein [Chitinispirillaceae bacterium]